MSKFLPDATDFTDIKKKEPREYCGFAECPKCHGYGMWNLTLNAYGEGKHFQASCFQCYGWGYVHEGSLDQTCIHEYDQGVNTGRCLHRYTCKKCGRSRIVDSSD